METLLESPVSIAILALTVIASLYVFQNPHQARGLMLNPYGFVHEKQYLTVLSSGFIHADLSHLLFNMFTFFFFAFELEKMMVMWVGQNGHLYFALVYILSMVLADVSTIIKHRNNPSYFSLGASGAVSGIIFSFILFLPTASFYLFLIPIPIPAPIFAILYVVYSVYAGRQRSGNINHEAHLWGAVAGLLLTILLFPGILNSFLAQISAMLERWGV